MNNLGILAGIGLCIIVSMVILGACVIFVALVLQDKTEEGIMKHLEYYGGDGWGSCPEGKEIEIKYVENGLGKGKIFHNVSDANAFYNSLNCEKFAWCNMDLIEGHTLEQSK